MNWMRSIPTKRSQNKSEIHKQQEFFERQRLSKLHNTTKPVKRKQHGTSQDLLKLVCISQVARQIESDSSGDESDADWIRSHRLSKVSRLSGDKRKQFIDPEPKMEVKDGRSLFQETLRPSYHSTPFQSSAIGYGLSGQVVGPTVNYTDHYTADGPFLGQHNLSPINFREPSSTLKKSDWSAEYQELVHQKHPPSCSSNTPQDEANCLFSDENDCMFLSRHDSRSPHEERRSVLNDLIAGDSYEEENITQDIKSTLVEQRTSAGGNIFGRNPVRKPADVDLFSRKRVKDAATSPVLFKTDIFGGTYAGMFARMKETTI